MHAKIPLALMFLPLISGCEVLEDIALAWANGIQDRTDDAGPGDTGGTPVDHVPDDLVDDGSGLAIWPETGVQPAATEAWIQNLGAVPVLCVASRTDGGPNELTPILLSGFGAAIGTIYDDHCADWSCSEVDSGVIVRTWHWSFGACGEEAPT